MAVGMNTEGSALARCVWYTGLEHVVKGGHTGMRTDYLFARPSFLRGVASLFDFAGALRQYNFMPDPRLSDEMAIRSDWQAVGDDLRQAMGQFEHEASREIAGVSPKAQRQAIDAERERLRQSMTSAREAFNRARAAYSGGHRSDA